MTISAGMIHEFKHEMAGVRKIIALSPSDTKFEWRPHPKSMTLGRLTGHLAELPGWGKMTLQGTELDLAAKTDRKALGSEPFAAATGLATFDRNVTEAVAAIESTDDNSWKVPWTLRSGSHVIFTMPRLAVMRISVINHMIHHRAQLGVYLRLLDIPIPGLYGPSADEM